MSFGPHKPHHVVHPVLEGGTSPSGQGQFPCEPGRKRGPFRTGSVRPLHRSLGEKGSAMVVTLSEKGLPSLPLFSVAVH